MLLDDHRQKFAGSSREPLGECGIKSPTSPKESVLDSPCPSLALVATGEFEDQSGSLPTAAEVEAAIRTIIASTGEDPSREGLAETPGRVARAYREWFGGYRIDPVRLLDRTFGEADAYEDTILLRSIPLASTCEHHLAPIIGVAHVAYRPRERVVGISKLSRLVDAYAHRLQLQERLTSQIARTLDEALHPRGVAVVIEATHGCMSTRGVRQHGVSMVTKCWLGEFKADPDLRREVMASIQDSRDRAR